MSWILSGLGATDGVAAVSQEQTTEQLEAAVLLTLARFVEWPALGFSSASAPVVAGIVADDAVALALESVSRGKNVGGRSLAVTRLQWDSDLAGLHMLFVGEAAKRHLPLLLERARARPIVSVSRLPDFGRAGGMITFTFTDGRISFAVNSAATALSTVRLSSFLLSHASRVSDESTGHPR